MTKKEFRQFAIKKRNSLSSEERISFSNQILQHLINSEIYQDSKKNKNNKIFCLFFYF